MVPVTAFFQVPMAFLPPQFRAPPPGFALCARQLAAPCVGSGCSVLLPREDERSSGLV